MLTILVPPQEFYDEKTNLFFQTKECTLKLEHSLLSISKWESKYHKPFLSKDKDDVRTPKEMLDYIKCMTINTVPEIVYDVLTRDMLLKVNDYIQDPMTATTIGSKSTSGRREIYTSEVIYYWMTAFNIPFECEKWHLNRLLMLIRVCNEMNKPPEKKIPDMAARRQLNEARLRAAAKKR